MHDSLHVLVIEDDPDTRQSLCEILALDDYHVESAATAAAAFTNSQWSSVSVVILDRKLPDATPEQLIPEIRLRAPTAAVIIVTGYADLNSTISALRLGAYDYLLKPINPDALRATLVRLVELREAQHRAMQSERLAAIGQMITGLAHESRNALQRTQACLEMLRLELEDQPAAVDLCDRIQKAQDDLARLYDELRSYAGPLHLECQDCDLVSIWRRAWSDLKTATREKSLTLRETIDTRQTRCPVDAFAMGQVFRNVLENSISASPPGSAIHICCADATFQHRPALVVSIRDQGAGIPAKHHGRIFEPFFTTKAKGTGLGMPIAKRIVEAHGGRIELGAAAEGAEILVTLPRGAP